VPWLLLNWWATMWTDYIFNLDLHFLIKLAKSFFSKTTPSTAETLSNIETSHKSLRLRTSRASSGTTYAKAKKRKKAAEAISIVNEQRKKVKLTRSKSPWKTCWQSLFTQGENKGELSLFRQDSHQKNI